MTGWFNWPYRPGMQVKLRAFSLSGMLTKIRGKWREHKDGETYTGRIVIKGMVGIRNGDYHQGPVKNHFVNNALQALMWAIQKSQEPFDGGWEMYLGTNTTVVTTATTTGLSAPMGTSPGTPPNSISMASNTLSNGGNTMITATWNPGSVSGTVGEIGLYAKCNNNGSYSSEMVSRLSVADGDFASFTINTSYSVSIAWTIQFVFS